MSTFRKLLFSRSLPSSGGGGGFFTKVFNIDAPGNANAVTTLTTDSSGCSIIICCVATFSGLPSSTLLDNKGNNYTLAVAKNTVSSYYTAIYYCVNPSVGSGHAWSISQSGKYPSICVIGFSGGSPTPTLDATSSFAGAGNVSSIQPGSITPSQNNEIIIVSRNGEDNGTISVNGSFAMFGQNSNTGGSERCGGAYLIQTTAVASNPTLTWAVNGNAVVAQSSFK
jgi:hypothetical protein